MSNTNFKFDRRTPAIYIGNESVKMVWEKGLKTEELAHENAAHIYHLEGVVNKVEGTAGEANQRSKDNTQRLDTVQGTANEANERSKNNLTRLDSVQGVALAAKTQAESNTTRLDTVQGTANAAKALADSNRILLSTVEGTANSGKALATECRTLIDGKANIEQVNYANVHLMIRNRYLYVIAPKGLLNEEDKVLFARYVGSSIRVKKEYETDTKKAGHYKRTGWIVPLWRRTDAENGERLSTAIVPMKWIKVKGDGKWDWFILLSSREVMEGIDEAEAEFSNDIAKVFCDICDRAFWYGINLHLWDKKLGICIVRNGQPITPYLPFTVRFNGLKKNDEGYRFDSVSPFLSRWI